MSKAVIVSFYTPEWQYISQSPDKVAMKARQRNKEAAGE